MKTTAADIIQTLQMMSDDAQRKVYMSFFKTGKGDYGEGDVFLGVRNPQVRMVVREAWQTTAEDEVIKLITNEIHEVRLCGLLILVKQMERADKRHNDDEMLRIFNLYCSLHRHINNWDLVDLSAITIVGIWETRHPEEKLLENWSAAKDSTLWQRRIAMVSTWRLIRAGRYDEVVVRAERLLDSREDLLYKAAGWMLRELGKIGDMQVLLNFLDNHVAQMPSVMLRYAIEKFAPQERKYWLERRAKKS